MNQHTSLAGPAPAPSKSSPPAAGRKSFLTTWLLSLLLGGLGIDRFYLGKIGTGILKLITFGGCGFWTLIDLVIVLVGGQRDKHGQTLAGYDRHKVIAWIVTVVVIVLGAVGGASAARGAGSMAADAGTSVVASGQEKAGTQDAPEKKTPAEVAPAKEAPAPAAEAATWTKVTTLTGSSDKASQTFELTGTEARMTYDFRGAGDMSMAAVYLQKEGTDLMVDGGIPVVMLDKAEKGATAVHKSSGRYFLQVSAANLDSWTVTIEEKR